MKVYFELSVWDAKKRKFKTAYFVCKKSNASHKKLKAFANNSTYWFEGLIGQNWHRGGWYHLDYGFINASLIKENNVQGVVFDNEVYLLENIRLDKPKRIKQL